MQIDDRHQPFDPVDQAVAHDLAAKEIAGEFGDKGTVGCNDFVIFAVDLKHDTDPGHLLGHAGAFGSLRITAHQNRFVTHFHLPACVSDWRKS
jgi:hypothetical protein